MILWSKSITFIKPVNKATLKQECWLELKITTMGTLKNFYVIIGLLFIVIAFIMIFFPPKFGNFLYGVRTKLTMKNSTLWAKSQRLYAYSFLATGIIFSILSILKLDEIIKPFPMVLLLICLWKFAEYFIQKYLVSKFPTT
jgi:uncharacterized membrane protein